MRGTWQLAIIKAFTAHWEMQIEQMVIFSKQYSNVLHFRYFEQELNMRLISKCLAIAVTIKLRKLSNHILEQHEQLSNHLKSTMCMSN